MVTENTAVKISVLKNTYNFVHVSDSHISVYDQDSTADEIEFANKHAKQWSVPGLDQKQAFCDAVEYADKSNADGLMVTGDCVDFIYKPNLDYVKEKFAAMKTELLYVPGNHETGDYDFKPSRAGISEPFISNYNDLMFGDPSFWVKDFGELLIIGIDDSTRCVSESQLSRLKEQSKRGLPIILLMHIPLNTEAITPAVIAKWGEGGLSHFTLGHEKHDDITKEFCKFVKSTESNVEAVIAGHSHLPENHHGEFAPGRYQHVAVPTFTGIINHYTVSK